MLKMGSRQRCTLRHKVDKNCDFAVKLRVVLLYLASDFW